MPERYLTPAELSELLHIPENTLQRWRSAEEGPSFVKMGQHVRYRQSDIDKWAQANLTRLPI